MDNKNFFCLTFLYHILLFFSIIFLSFYPAKFLTCLLGDDLWFSTLAHGERLFDCLLENFHGSQYLGLMVDKFLIHWLPRFFGIHPMDFIDTYAAFVKACFMFLILLQINNIVQIFYYNKIDKDNFKISKIFYLASLTFIIIGFFIILDNSNSWVNFIYYAFFRYFFSFLFFAPVIYFLSAKFVYQESYKSSRLQNWLCYFAIFVITTGIELQWIISLIFISCLLIADILLKNKINKQLLISGIYQSIFIFMLLSKSSFQRIANERGISANHLLFEDWAIIFKEFSIQFIDFCCNCAEIWSLRNSLSGEKAYCV